MKRPVIHYQGGAPDIELFISRLDSIDDELMDIERTVRGQYEGEVVGWRGESAIFAADQLHGAGQRVRSARTTLKSLRRKLKKKKVAS